MTRNLLVLQLACLLAAAIGFASADEPEKLVGGSMARIGQFPYMAALRSNGYPICGGAIISEQHILTAAHCVIDSLHDLQNLTVATGTILLVGHGEIHHVEKILVHPHYKKNVHWYYDAAVIKLQQPIVFNRVQKKINLPTQDVRRDIKAVVTGWGRLSETKAKRPMILQKLEVTLIDTCTCETHLNYPIYDDMICALDTVDHGTCAGDSGAPLVYNNEVIGIVSGGMPCALGVPDVYTSVWWMRYFIQDALTQ